MRYTCGVLKYAQKHYLARLMQLPLIAGSIVLLACLAFAHITRVRTGSATSPVTIVQFAMKKEPVKWNGEFAVFVPNSSTVTEVGSISGSVETKYFGSHRLWKKTVMVTAPSFATVSSYQGPAPNEQQLDKLYLGIVARAWQGQISEAAPYAKVGQTVTYFDDPTSRWIDLFLSTYVYLLWLVAVGASCAVLVHTGRRLTRGYLVIEGRCRDCGYELRGSTGDVCPECGVARRSRAEQSG